MPSSARLEAGHGEDKRSWEKEDEGYAKEFLQGSGGDGHSSSYVSLSPVCGRWPDKHLAHLMLVCCRVRLDNGRLSNRKGTSAREEP